MPAMLASDHRLEVIGRASDGLEAVEQVDALQPEVVAMDIVLPTLDGIEATKRIRARHPECGVVLVSGSIFQERSEHGSSAAQEAGATSYVLKSRAPLDLADAVAAAARPRRS